MLRAGMGRQVVKDANVTTRKDLVTVPQATNETTEAQRGR